MCELEWHSKSKMKIVNTCGRNEQEITKVMRRSISCFRSASNFDEHDWSLRLQDRSKNELRTPGRPHRVLQRFLSKSFVQDPYASGDLRGNPHVIIFRLSFIYSDVRTCPRQFRSIFGKPNEKENFKRNNHFEVIFLASAFPRFLCSPTCAWPYSSLIIACSFIAPYTRCVWAFCLAILVETVVIVAVHACWCLAGGSPIFSR